jgi:hypothetical protein
VLNGSATKHLVHVGLNDLEMLLPKSLAVTMLKQIKDLKQGLIANLFTGKKHGGVDSHVDSCVGTLGLTSYRYMTAKSTTW